MMLMRRNGKRFSQFFVSFGEQFTEVKIEIVYCKEKRPLKADVNNGIYPLSFAKNFF